MNIKSQDWHPAQVKAALEMRGITVTGLGSRNSYDRTAVSKALRRPWPAVERIVAAALGLHPKVIWPSRYDSHGRPLREGRWAQHSTAIHEKRRVACAGARARRVQG